MTPPEPSFPNDLFEEDRKVMLLAPGAVLLGDFAATETEGLLDAIRGIETTAPFRQMITPGGWPMSVAMTNCG